MSNGDLLKAPAFQFYPKDFLTDSRVMAMSNEVRGMYITLLCVDWLNDGFFETDILKLGGFEWRDPRESDYDKVLPEDVEFELQGCFVPHPTKLHHLTSPLLLEAREKQRLWREKSALGGKKGAVVRKARAITSSYERKGGSEMVHTKRQPNVNQMPTLLSPVSSLQSSDHNSNNKDLGIKVIEGDARGSRLPFFTNEKESPVVFMTQEEKIKLDTKLGTECTKFLIGQMEDWARDNPKSYKTKKDHYRTIINMFRMRTADGSLFGLHPTTKVYGFYANWVFKLNEERKAPNFGANKV
jgi:hypothetical protein